ncbi:MAG: SRPBCC family protein [Pseudonocardiales bacterium]|nr:SRPBCC family protein [Actinomycetota bacterium]
MVPRLVLAGATATLLVAARTTLRNWGATKAECRAVLPGDEFVPEPAVVITRAVTVEAPAEEVWCWLVQIGQGRGGMYSYEGIENALGLDIHNADEIRPEWQHLAVGDEVRLVRRGWLGMPDGLALEVGRIEPGRSIVLLEEPWHAVWSFHIRPHGPRRCRLVSRSRSLRARGAARLTGELLDPITMVMTRKMLLGIKIRAERSTRTSRPHRSTTTVAQSP